MVLCIRYSFLPFPEHPKEPFTIMNCVLIPSLKDSKYPLRILLNSIICISCLGLQNESRCRDIKEMYYNCQHIYHTFIYLIYSVYYRQKKGHDFSQPCRNYQLQQFNCTSEWQFIHSIHCHLSYATLHDTLDITI